VAHRAANKFQHAQQQIAENAHNAAEYAVALPVFGVLLCIPWNEFVYQKLGHSRGPLFCVIFKFITITTSKQGQSVVE
jgi:hypothetical protein